jgi:hypothetical protein
MVLDGGFGARASALAAHLAEAEKGAELARAEYHTLIRRAHLAGGSFREIAQAVGLSHQRVQQIVEGAGGTWWGKVWGSRNRQRDLICSFCGRPPSEVKKLIAGPSVYVCDGCVEKAERAFAGRASPFALTPLRRARCAFCGKARAADRPIALCTGTGVCAACLTLCRQILEDRGPSPAAPAQAVSAG